MRSTLSAIAVLAITIVLWMMFGRIHWPENVGLAVSRLSGALGGIGIEDTENLFMLLSFLFALAIAVLAVAIARRYALRGTR